MQNNDIIFFNLHRRYVNDPPQLGSFLGIFLLSAFLSSNGYNAQGYAGEFEAGKKLLDEICLAGKAQSVGLYCDYENVTENIFLSRYVKERYKLPVFVGGPQAAALGEKFLRESGCDAIGRYEGELTTLELLNSVLDGTGDLNGIKGIAYLRSGQYVQNEDRQPIVNLDALPFIDENCYLTSPPRPDVLNIMTGRGCPFNCAFCHEGSQSRQVRFRSIENVLAEIDIFLAKQKDNQQPYILFVDDTLTLKPERVKALCAGLKARREKQPFQWFCEGHIHTLCKHPEMISCLADAGLTRLQLGIESGNQKVLDAYRKGSTLEEIREVVRLCCEAGIPQICGNLILGGAFFSREVYERDMTFAKELLSMSEGRLDMGVVSYWPLPGTSMTNYPERYGIKIFDEEFLTSVGDFPQTETEDLNRWDILWLMQHTWEELERHMMDMVRHDQVPRKMIMDWISPSTQRVVNSVWWSYLIRHDDLISYYSMLASGETMTSDELSIDFLDAHPMRTMPAIRALKRTSDGHVSLKTSEYRLSNWERDTFILAAGKLSVKDIAAHLRQTYDVTQNEAELRVCEALHSLESHKVMVFTER